MKLSIPLVFLSTAILYGCEAVDLEQETIENYRSVDVGRGWSNVSDETGVTLATFKCYDRDNSKQSMLRVYLLNQSGDEQLEEGLNPHFVAFSPYEELIGELEKSDDNLVGTLYTDCKDVDVLSPIPDWL